MNYVRSEGLNEQSRSNIDDQINETLFRKDLLRETMTSLLRATKDPIQHMIFHSLRQHCTAHLLYRNRAMKRFYNVLAILPCGIMRFELGKLH